jgi:hypothetical protein
MSSRLPTPSALKRIEACPRSETFQRVRTSSRYSAGGTVAHAYLEDVLAHGVDAALERAPPDARAGLELIDLAHPLMPTATPGAWVAEVAVAYNPETGTARVLGSGLTREQARDLAEPHEMVGIVDAATFVGDAVVTLDYKFGRRAVDSADTNLQVRTYALMLARAYGKRTARVVIARAPIGASPWFSISEMSELDLFEHESRVLDVLAAREAALAGDAPPLHLGEHCDYCPALPFCPAHIAIAREMLAAPGEVAALEQQAATLATPEAKLALYEKLEAAGRVRKIAEAALERAVRLEPVPLPDGRVLDKPEQAVETINPVRAVPFLLERFPGALGQAIVEKALEQKPPGMTKERVKTVTRSLFIESLPKSERPTLTRFWADLFRDMRESGAMTVRMQERPVGIYRPKPDEVAANGADPPPE